MNLLKIWSEMQQSPFAHPARPQKKHRVISCRWLWRRAATNGVSGDGFDPLDVEWSVAFREQKAVESWNMIKHASPFCHCALY